METNVCSACGHVNDEGKKFCGECGAKLEPVGVTCHACGHVNTAGIKFCGECGQTLGEPAPTATITMNKESYEEGEEISVVYTGITGVMEKERAFIGVYKSGADHGDYGDYQYPAAGDNDLIFKAPLSSGDYELRLYCRDGQYDDTTFVTKAPFHVEAEQGVEVNLYLNKEAYEPGEQINVIVAGVSQGMAGANAFVAIYKAGADHGDWGNYLYTPAGESQQDFNAPAETGDYEIRFFKRDGQYDDSTFVKSVPFSIAESVAEDIVCPSCGYNNPAGTKFCNECGVKLEAAQNCPACGAELKPGLKFCNDCGEKL